MRIRNSRSPFLCPPVPDPISRSSRLLHFEDCFLVEETNRQIGWSFNPLKNPACQIAGEGSCSELKKVTSRETEPINCQDREKGKTVCMQEKSRQGLGGEPEKQDIEANEGNDRDGRGSSGAVNFDIAPPFASSKLAQRPYKIKKQTYRPETINKEEVAIPGKVIEPRKVPKQEDVEDKYGSKRTRTLCCPINCEYFFPPDNKGVDGHELPEGMGLEDTAEELKEKPRRGRKRKEDDESGDADWFIETYQGKRGKRQNRGGHSAYGNNGCMEMKKRKRGRPKRV